MPLHRFECEAMATTFEVIIAQEDVDAVYAAQAAEAVFTEIARLEDELSRFRHTSDIFRLSQLRSGQSIGVSWLCGIAYHWPRLSIRKPAAPLISPWDR